MDIQVASNFERYLFYLFGGDSEKVQQAMTEFGRGGRLQFSAEQREMIAEDFLAMTVDTAQTIATIGDFHAATGYILDPHTAVGVRAGHELSGGEVPVVCLATAHPAKFGDAVHRATGTHPQAPLSLAGIESKDRRCEMIDADTEAIKAFVEKHAL
jgi:threonine synthase